MSSSSRRACAALFPVPPIYPDVFAGHQRRVRVAQGRGAKGRTQCCCLGSLRRAAILFLSVITILELEQGILLIERRDSPGGSVLRAWLTLQVLPTFEGRILPIDTAVAQRCAKLHVPDPRGERDALIAATALTHGMIVVTRNVADFEPTGVEILNPWND